MSRKDLLVFLLWCVAVLTLLAPVWIRCGMTFFNHGDLYAYHAPLRSLTASSLIEGHLPFWNPYILLGTPHAANPQAVLFYPPALLAAVFPVVAALTWDQILHILWAGLGVFLLARAHRLDRAGAAVLASAYALSPFLIYRVTAGIPTLLAALSWAPWVWLAWLSGAPGLLGASLALQLLSGHGQFLLINLVAITVWSLCRDGRRVLLSRLAREGVIALVLTAVQWVPTAQFLRLSVRSDWSGAMSGAYALAPGALWTWLSPGALGTPLSGDWLDAVSVFYETCGGCVGLLALALAFWGAARGRRRAPVLVLAALGVFLAFGPRGILARRLLNFAALSYLRTPSRWLFLAVWAAVLSAGAGWAALSARRWPSGARLGAVLAVFLPLAFWDAAFLRPQDPSVFLAARCDIAERLGGRPLRVLTDPALANPNKSILYRLRNVNGYEAFYLKSVPPWAAAAEGEAAADASRVFVSRWPSKVLARAGVGARLAADGLSESPAWPLAAFIDASGRRVGNTPRVTLERAGRWRVLAFPPVGAAAMTLAEISYPGWRVWVAGSPARIEAWDGVFQSVAVPAGFPRHSPFSVTLEFRPTLWPWLALLSAAAWALWLSAFARRAEDA